jgi:hypothetical protein
MKKLPGFAFRVIKRDVSVKCTPSKQGLACFDVNIKEDGVVDPTILGAIGNRGETRLGDIVHGD